MTTAGDSFDRANSTKTLGSTTSGGLTWSALVGTWGIDGNQAYCPTGLTGSIAVVETGSSDHNAQVIVAVKSSGNPLLAIRVSAANTYIGYNAGGNQLIRNVKGTITTTSSLRPSYAPGQSAATLVVAPGDTVGLSATGSIVSVYKNGTKICTFADTSTGTKAGLKNDGYLARFDDFSVASARSDTLTNSAAPAITGETTPGQTLAVSTGTWSPTPDSYTYQWQRAGVDISGATTNTHVLVDADLGQAIVCSVTAVKAAYPNGVAVSAATSIPGGEPSGPTIRPTDSNIVYSPYVWDVTSTRAQTINSGAYLRTTIASDATSVVANFDLAGFSGTVSLWVRVDDAAPYLATHSASVNITIPSNNWPKHTVEILVSRVTGANRWSDPPTTRVRFTGFVVAPDTVTTTTRRRPYNVLCYGDSILEGYSTVQNGVTDARFGWGYVLRDLLGAEVGTVGFNASGLTTGGESNTPALTNSYKSLWAGTARSFSPEPTVIIVNSGTNDGATNITAAATTVLNGLLAATKASKIVVVQQYNSTAHKSQWQAAITGCAAPSRVSYVDTTGWLLNADTRDNTHPYGYINVTDLSPRLAAVIAPLISGSTGVAPKRFINVGGVAKPIA